MTEDEEAKKTVQEAIWTWTQRLVVALVVFGAGTFCGYLLWGSGEEGAPHLRVVTAQQEEQIRDLRNKNVDVQSRMEKYQGDAQRCAKDLAECRTKAATAGAGGN